MIDPNDKSDGQRVSKCIRCHGAKTVRSNWLTAVARWASGRHIGLAFDLMNCLDHEVGITTRGEGGTDAHKPRKAFLTREDREGCDVAVPVCLWVSTGLLSPQSALYPEERSARGFNVSPVNKESVLYNVSRHIFEPPCPEKAHTEWSYTSLAICETIISLAFEYLHPAFTLTCNHHQPSQFEYRVVEEHRYRSATLYFPSVSDSVQFARIYTNFMLAC